MKRSLKTGLDARALAIQPEALSAEYDERDAQDTPRMVSGGIAIVDIDGPLSHKGGFWSWCDNYESIYARFRCALESDETRAVLLQINSPGGEAAGMQETLDRMLAIKSKIGKPVYAYADEMAYSAAYGLACAADEIYLPRTGGVGSVGVIAMLAEQTASDEANGLRYEVVTSGDRKADGHPHVKMSDGAIDHVKRRVGHLARIFHDAVAKARGMSREAVSDLQADSFYGKHAVRAGLADGVMSLDATLRAIRTKLAGETSELDKGKNRVDSTPTDRSNNGSEKAMARELKLTNAVSEAKQKLTAAKSASERVDASRAFAAAEAELAKYKKTSKTTTEEADDGSEAGSESGSESGSEEGSESSPESTGSDDGKTTTSTGDSSDASGSDAGESSDDDAKSRAVKTVGASKFDALEKAGLRVVASTGLYTHDRLLRMCRKATGERSIAAVMGALDAMFIQRDTLAKSVKKIERERADEQRATLIEKGIASGKLTPAMAKKWATKQSPEALAAFLEHAPAQVHAEGEASAAKEDTDAATVTSADITPAMAKAWTLQGFKPADFPRLLALNSANVDAQSKLYNGKANGASK